MHGIGKIPDIFAHRGISHAVKAHGIDGLFDATLRTLTNCADRGLVFTNFVDVPPEALSIGQKVKVKFQPTENGPPVPVFVPV